MFEEFYQLSGTSVTILTAFGLLLLHFLSRNLSFFSRETRKEPPGPKRFPLIGNLHVVDLNRLDASLFAVRTIFPSLSANEIGNCSMSGRQCD